MIIKLTHTVWRGELDLDEFPHYVSDLVTDDGGYVHVIEEILVPADTKIELIQ